MQKRDRGASGFALIELLFAAGVLALVISLLFGSLLNVSTIGQLSENQALAVSRVSSISEELRTATLADLLAYEPPDFEGLGVAESIQVSCLDSAGEEIELPFEGTEEDLANPLPNPVEVFVQVSWQDERGHTFTIGGSTKIGR